MDDLSFEIENLGVIKEGRFTQKPLTLFCGPNNSGKTWAMYSLYYSHKLMKQFSQAVHPEATDLESPTLSKFNKNLESKLPYLLHSSASALENAVFRIADKHRKEFANIVREKQKRSSFLMPAERSGLHLIYRELSAKRTALLHDASRENINLRELLRDVIHSRYAVPIADYIDWLNKLADVQRVAPGDFHSSAGRVKKDLVRGSYQIDKATGDITFKPYKLRRRRKTIMGLHMTSSTVKSLFGLWFYLEKQAKPGDLLMIDEPELNIHPKNQVKMARLLAGMVNAGLNVVISTHSDYMVREFNTLLMLSGDESGCLKQKYGYDHKEIRETLRPEQVGAYLFDRRTVKPFEITSEDGIYATTFDDVIKELNRVNDGVYYALQEQRTAHDDD